MYKGNPEKECVQKLTGYVHIFFQYMIINNNVGVETVTFKISVRKVVKS